MTRFDCISSCLAVASESPPSAIAMEETATIAYPTIYQVLALVIAAAISSFITSLCILQSKNIVVAARKLSDKCAFKSPIAICAFAYESTKTYLSHAFASTAATFSAALDSVAAPLRAASHSVTAKFSDTFNSVATFIEPSVGSLHGFLEAHSTKGKETCAGKESDEETCVGEESDKETSAGEESDEETCAGEQSDEDTSVDQAMKEPVKEESDGSIS
ncbi:hypothetical protein LTR09_011409 [Extremus antarcticus]|uniref:Uncharacterized protein n=1 Tax=Extremus antarcticus TaxID=702011 RepID=A0AAJ0DBS8_9PEZI|nr:hypothetical protein LTR09_011409 [Extremus antarcticus]